MAREPVTLGLDLDEAMSRLERALDSELDGSKLGPSRAELPEAERELLAELGLGELGVGAGLSFSGPGAGATPAPVADEGAAARLLTELIDRAQTRARVETRSRGRVVATTQIDHSGDITCSVNADLAPELRARHLGALDDELRAQRERTALLVSTLQMAAKIALAAGTGSVLLALPAAWKFIRKLLSEQGALQPQ